MTLKEQLQAIQQKAIERLEQAKETQAVEDIRIKYLGKKGDVTQVLKGMKDLSPEERPIVGKLANDVRDTIQAKISERKAVLHQEALNKQLEEETIDVTLPGTTHSVAQTHIILQVIEEIEDLFLGMGYKIVEGNEVETEHYNFERINVPKHHPARDMQDTFYIDESYLLRTQTSGTQPRTLEQHNFEEGPLKMISPGKVYRRDTDDATHSHQFHQIEGLVIDKDIAMTDLKGTLEEVAKAMFGDKHDIRLRPSYFPFTEPSVEVDVTCFKCQGSDEHCSVCKNTGWIEILGAGMVHPHVLEMSGVDPTVYGGFAFGLGPDRIAMLKHEIDDIRHFYTNDQRFLSQFKMKG
ncbi:phenylalanine--tRNA ligase subunit alpha [Dolosigranulum pigrum]|uniref:phenylalanine--tRNA ligase subunit alpha n=1 Tax=Dolosigranulum pigrum TaxID=29394 RepID=UPI000DC50E53|nr:phenylalanine--tRNA ligase subunit alpha [Dolosigranulum pigrum]RAN53554.1 phenylalanine--tRNA ligase subunit alpha [Dolosigranulum pigrum]